MKVSAGMVTKTPVIIFDEVAGGWKLFQGERVELFGWNPQFMRIGDEAVLVSWTARRRVGEGSTSQVVEVPLDKEIPAVAVVQHKRPESGVSIMQLDACIGQQLSYVLTEHDVVYGSTLQRI